MNRLTMKAPKNDKGWVYTIKPETSTRLAEKKLGQLEDIEEELGIDLITLFKALTNGVYVWNNDDLKDEIIIDDVVSITNYIQDESNRYELVKTDNYRLIGIFTYELKDYGKTWALSREELEDDK